MIKKNSKSVTTEVLNEAVETIIQGVDNLFKEERKFNVQTFATKEDLKREVLWVKNDIKGLTEELSSSPSRQEFAKLKGKVDKYLAS
jgi:hypothetical protein